MCPAPKLYLKVEVQGAVHSTRSVKSHANSHRICALEAQKDSSGCGARRMANLYRALKDAIKQLKNKTPQGTGVFFLLVLLGCFY